MSLLAPNALACLTDFSGTTGSLEQVGEFRLSMQINAVSMLVEQELKRPLGRTVFDITTTPPSPALVAGTSGRYVQLPIRPIESITSVVDIYGITLTSYQVINDKDAKHGLVYRLFGWPAVAAISDFVTFDPDMRNRQFNLQFSYVGGYVLPNDQMPTGLPAGVVANPLPWDIRQAVFDEVLSGLSGSIQGSFGAGQAVIEEKTAGGQSVRYSDAQRNAAMAKRMQTRLSDQTKDVLSGYNPKRWA